MCIPKVDVQFIYAQAVSYTTLVSGWPMPDERAPNDIPDTPPARGRLRRAVSRAGELVRRHGARTLRWLVGGLILVAAVIGLLFITRGTAVRREQMHHERYAAVAHARRLLHPEEVLQARRRPRRLVRLVLHAHERRGPDGQPKGEVRFHLTIPANRAALACGERRCWGQPRRRRRTAR